SDPEPRVREQAAKLAERTIAGDQAVRARVMALADDPDPMVRFQTALSLGQAHRDPRVIEALARIAMRDAEAPWPLTGVLSAIPHRASALIEVLAARGDFLGTTAGRSWLGELSLQVGAERDPAQVERLFTELFEAKVDSDTLIRVVLAVGRGL